MASERVVEGKGLYAWLDRRFPVTPLLKNHLAEYYAPKNLNFWYFFGSLATVVLVLQILTGIFLVMHYKPDASLNSAGIPIAFASVEYIMRASITIYFRPTMTHNPYLTDCRPKR